MRAGQRFTCCVGDGGCIKWACGLGRGVWWSWWWEPIKIVVHGRLLRPAHLPDSLLFPHWWTWSSNRSAPAPGPSPYTCKSACHFSPSPKRWTADFCSKITEDYQVKTRPLIPSAPMAGARLPNCVAKPVGLRSAPLSAVAASPPPPAQPGYAVTSPARWRVPYKLEPSGRWASPQRDTRSWASILVRYRVRSCCTPVGAGPCVWEWWGGGIWTKPLSGSLHLGYPHLAFWFVPFVPGGACMYPVYPPPPSAPALFLVLCFVWCPPCILYYFCFVPLNYENTEVRQKIPTKLRLINIYK